ncbi:MULTISPECIES: bestrophin family protein [unclassified Ekhidna]|jgi:putative membrane protein|uniref:bestrophin family protein n=1 Tax=unclassified Ekhidna TaxID=2632188 RepID=UPI0032E04B34
MIQYNPKSWFSLIFDVYSRYVIRALFPLIMFAGVLTTVLCFLFIDVLQVVIVDTKAFHSILGVILGLFLVLRTNTAYDRWWEGRKLWGQLVNDTRQLSIKITTFIPLDAKEDRLFFKKMIPNVTFAMKNHLRNSILVGEMDFYDEKVKERIINSNHRPNIINKILMERVMDMNKRGLISADKLFILDKEIKGFTDIIGACERIKSTPIPYSYSMFIKKFLFIYCITLPMTFIGEFGYWSIILVVVAFYFLMSVELISEEIEDPFGRDINDLPLDELCVKIKKNIIEIFNNN